MAEQQFCLRWNNFQANIVSSFESLLDGEEFVDVTLTAEGKSVKAHRVLLSACSPYFRDLFRDLPPHQHPVIVLRDTSFQELKSLLSFIYHGEVNVSQERLGLLLKTAEALRIKGLAQDKKSKDQFGSIGSSPEKEPDESLDKNERERRCGPSSPSLPMSFSGVPVSGMPPSNPLTSLEPPSHKPIGTAAHIIMPSPPSKRRKHLHSPHSAPPPSLVALREPPPPTTSSSSSSSSTALHEEDNAPVGMNLSTTGSTPNAGPLSPRMVPKVEVMEEEGSSSVGRGSGNGGHIGMGDVSDNEADEARSHDGELGELDTSTTSSSDLHGLPPHLSAAVQNFVPYVAAAAGSSQLDTFPGPSGVLPQASQAGWRGGHPESSDTSAQGGHPVFNELLCGDGGYGGKKAVPTPCPVCAKVLSNAYNMRVHLETHQDITYKCIICGIITRTRDTMRKHLSNVHKLRNVELKNSFKKLTGKSSSNSTSLATTTTTTSPPTTTSTTPSKMSSPALSVRSKKVSSPPSGSKAAIKAEPGVDMTPSSMEAMEAIEAINLAKGNNLASIVSKLSQKQ